MKTQVSSAVGTAKRGRASSGAIAASNRPIRDFRVLVHKSAATCLKGWWAKDARAVYFRGEVVAGADPGTLQVLETAPFNYAFDKNAHYDQGVNLATLKRPAEEEAAFQKVYAEWKKR